jgi:hypothetical protein
VHLSVFPPWKHLLQTAIYGYLTGMKQLSFMVLIAAAIACGCKQRAKERTLYNKEFDWTITIPAGFDSMTNEEIGKLQEQGIEDLEKTYGQEAKLTNSNLFGFTRRRATYFYAGWELFNPAEDGDYEELCRLWNEMIYVTLKARTPGAILDSFSATETISGLEFPVFRVKVWETSKTASSSYTEFMYYIKPFGKKVLLINIASADRNDQLAIMTAWRKSKFGAGDGSLTTDGGLPIAD